MTNDYTIMLPLMIACISATLLAKRGLGKITINVFYDSAAWFCFEDGTKMYCVRFGFTKLWIVRL